jgi:hypothetical protein
LSAHPLTFHRVITYPLVANHSQLDEGAAALQGLRGQLLPALQIPGDIDWV